MKIILNHNNKALFSNKIGFTLIELLAVIVILSIIALIATPIILGIIENAKKEAIRDSAYGLIAAAEKYLALSNVELENKEFIIEDNAFLDEQLSVSGQLPDSGSVIVRSDGKVQIAAKTDKWCALKDYEDSKVTLTDDLSKCSRSVVEATNEACFAFQSQTGAITAYYDYEGNNSSNEPCPKDVVIPNKINGQNVLNIANNAFYNKTLTNVIIPDSVTSIGNLAFYANTHLKSVTIGNGVINIGTSAFRESPQLETVTIGNKVEMIGNFAFYYCKLRNIVIPNSVTTIGDSAFNGNQLVDVKVGNGVVSIGSSAFYNNQIKNLTIGNKIEIIKDRAFAINQIESIVIPNSTTMIGDSAFYNNKINSLVLGNSLETIGSATFSYNKLTEIIIPSSVDNIGNGAFGNNQLTDVIIKGKIGISDFSTYGTYIWGWTSGYTDNSIRWNG